MTSIYSILTETILVSFVQTYVEKRIICCTWFNRLCSYYVPFLHLTCIFCVLVLLKYIAITNNISYSMVQFFSHIILSCRQRANRKYTTWLRLYIGPSTLSPTWVCVCQLKSYQCRQHYRSTKISFTSCSSVCSVFHFISFGVFFLHFFWTAKE